MKLITLLLAICLVAPVAYGQTLTEKDINDKGSLKPAKLVNAPRKVYIQSFKVLYQMLAEAEATAHGGRQFGGGKVAGKATARMAVGVKGVDVPDLQEVTNQLYAEFVAELKSNGFEIMTGKDAQGIKFYENWELIEGPHVNQEQLPGYLMVAPEGYDYLVKRVTKKGKEKTTFLDKAYVVSKQMDDVIVADVQFVLPSIWLDAKSSQFLGTAKVKGGPAFQLQNATVKFQSGQGKGMIPKASYYTMLKKPVPIPGVFKAEKFKAATLTQKTTVPSYASFFTVNNVKVDLGNYIECDANEYKTAAKNVMDQYMGLVMDSFLANAK